jgi:O-antigen biosynthesis protein
MDNGLIKDYPEIEFIKIDELDDNTSVKKMFIMIGSNKRVVDFGCGTGYLSWVLNKQGCTVTGVEINPHAAKIAEKYCQEVIVSDLDFVSVKDILPHQEFDVAIFGDILEHLRNPWQVLRDVKQVLKKDGYIVASIPNIAHGAIRLALLQGKFDYMELGILDNTHLRFFTRKSVESLFEDSGYLVNKIERTRLPIVTNTPLVPKISRDDFDNNIFKLVEESSESETLQFIIMATPDTINGRYNQLSDRYSNLLQESEKTQLQLQQTQQELTQSQLQIQQTQQELTRSQLQLQQTQQELTQSQLQIQQTQAELERSQITQTQTQLQDILSQLQQTQMELERSKATILAMGSSKFWYLRKIWFALRRNIGLKNDDIPLQKNLFIKSVKLIETFNKLKRIWRERGTEGTVNFIYASFQTKFSSQTDYQKLIQENCLTRQDIANAHRQIEKWQLIPKFSVILPVYNVDAQWLKKAIESVINQIYPHWELCIADDASPSPHIRKILTHYSELDERIKVVFRTENANISAASNSALEIATGDYIALLDHDDELAINALFENAKLINQHPEADFIYSDEDKIDIKGKRRDPFFKPDWSPEYFHSCMYTCHLGVYRTSIIKEIGAFRSEYDGSQDYDLVLRVVEKTKNIYHIPKILYHWRIIPSSVTSGEEAKPWAYIAAQKSLEDMLNRSEYPGHVEKTERAGFWQVRRDIQGEPSISIIIPSAAKTIDTSNGHLCLLENCIRSIEKISTYRHFEIIVVDGYDIPETVLANIAGENIQLVRCANKFNFSERINLGAAHAKSEYLLLLNDDTEVITSNWLELMLELSQQKEIAAVGAKLLFPNGKIQHAGVTILNGNPGHVFYGCEKEHPGYFCSNIVNRNYLGVTGACLMMRKEVFEELGGLDEEFPLNYNDVDLCLKAHQAGYRNVVTPFVELIHYESVSRGEGLKPGEWEKLNNKWKHYLNGLNKDPYYNPNLSNKNANFELL